MHDLCPPTSVGLRRSPRDTSIAHRSIPTRQEYGTCLHYIQSPNIFRPRSLEPVLRFFFSSGRGGKSHRAMVFNFLIIYEPKVFTHKIAKIPPSSPRQDTGRNSLPVPRSWRLTPSNLLHRDPYFTHFLHIPHFNVLPRRKSRT